MITVFKYIIHPFTPETELGEGAKILSVGYQNGNICLWAQTDTELGYEVRSFKVFGTGWEIEEIKGYELKFIGTVQYPEGLVFHVFEELKKSNLI